MMRQGLSAISGENGIIERKEFLFEEGWWFWGRAGQVLSSLARLVGLVLGELDSPRLLFALRFSVAYPLSLLSLLLKKRTRRGHLRFARLAKSPQSGFRK